MGNTDCPLNRSSVISKASWSKYIYVLCNIRHWKSSSLTRNSNGHGFLRGLRKNFLDNSYVLCMFPSIFLKLLCKDILDKKCKVIQRCLMFYGKKKTSYFCLLYSLNTLVNPILLLMFLQHWKVLVLLWPLPNFLLWECFFAP